MKPLLPRPVPHVLGLLFGAFLLVELARSIVAAALPVPVIAAALITLLVLFILLFMSIVNGIRNQNNQPPTPPTP